MSAWFECKVKYHKTDNSGKERKVTEPYLVEAVSFTDAEKRIHEKIIQYVSGEFEVTNISIARFSEIHPNENGDRWFKCKVSFITLDEERGLEKKTNTFILVEANTLLEAYEHLEEGLRGIVSDYSIPSIAESPILDIFPYEGQDKTFVDRTPAPEEVSLYNADEDEEEEEETSDESTDNADLEAEEEF